MKEFRLTFAAEDFAVVSQALVAMGVSFHVEPVASAPKETEVPGSVAPSVAKPRSPATGARKAPTTRKTKPSKPGAPVPPANAPMGGADRLREAIARSGNAYRSVMEPPKAATESEGSATGPESGAPIGE